MPNFELANDAVAYIPIQTLGVEGNPVPPPAGDTFTVASSDPGLTAAVGTMPSGPLQGAVCAVLTPTVPTDANVTITLTDADNLTAYTLTDDPQAVRALAGLPRCRRRGSRAASPAAGRSKARVSKA